MVMANKTGKKNIELEKSSRKDQFVVLLENMRDEIKLVAEGNLMLQESMDRGFEEINIKIDTVKNELEMDIGAVKADVEAVKADVVSIREEMRMGFRGMMAESIAIDKKMDQKANKKDLLILEKRVTKLETAR